MNSDILHKHKGFSLFEVLIVVNIIAILVIISYISIPGQLAKARDGKRKSDLYKIRTGLDEYYTSNGSYPRGLPDCDQPIKSGDEVILKKVPCDPQKKSPYYYQVKTGEPKSFRLYAQLENTIDSIIDEVGCRGGCGQDCLYNYGVHSPNIDLIKCSYVCAPGGGKQGSCELYNNPEISKCPKIYPKDSNCNNECSIANNRCENASGKNIPY